MFTGIIEYTGKIVEERKKGKGKILKIECPEIAKELKEGESISVDGACLTVTNFDDKTFEVFLSHETLKRTNFQRNRKNQIVNLELPVKVGDRLSGHIVQGHVDCTAKVISIRKLGEEKEIEFMLDKESHFICEKGSIAINGVSMTVTEVKGRRFKVTMIPYTAQKTNLSKLKTGDTVNIEFDIIAKYLQRMK